jgi:agmatinase
MPPEPLDLEELRRLYAGSGGADIQDPHFREVATLSFKGGDKRRWPLAEPSTLLDARYIQGAITVGAALVGARRMLARGSAPLAVQG